LLCFLGWTFRTQQIKYCLFLAVVILHLYYFLKREIMECKGLCIQ
jgi:hypothetical protein